MQNLSEEINVVLQKSKEIALNESNRENREEVLTFASELWRLYFLPNDTLTRLSTETNGEASQLNELSYQLGEFLEQNLRIEKKREVWRLMMIAYLSPLDLDINTIDGILNRHPQGNSQIVDILEEAFKLNYFHNSPSELDRCNPSDAYNKVLEFLNLYGFQKTYYIQRSIYSLLDLRTSDIRDFEASLRSSGFTGINFQANKKNQISSEKVFKAYHESLLNGQGTPLNLADAVCRSFLYNHFQINSFIQRVMHKFFYNVSLNAYHHKINSMVEEFETKHLGNFSGQTLGEKPLTQKILRMEIAYPFEFDPQFNEREENFIIDGGGSIIFEEFKNDERLSQSSRYQHDRMVLFGRYSGDAFANDINLEPRLEGLSRNHFMIITSDEGYFISDISSGGTVMRKMGVEKVRLTKGTLIQFGARIIVVVHEIRQNSDGSTYVHFKSVGAEFQVPDTWSTMSGIEEKVIGRAAPFVINEPKLNVMWDGQIRQQTVSRDHAKITLEYGEVYIKQDKPATFGTYILLKTFEEAIKGAPSKFYMIERDSEYRVDDITFKFRVYS